MYQHHTFLYVSVEPNKETYFHAVKNNKEWDLEYTQRELSRIEKVYIGPTQLTMNDFYSKCLQYTKKKPYKRCSEWYYIIVDCMKLKENTKKETKGYLYKVIVTCEAKSIQTPIKSSCCII
jgi:hypothetical protein